MTHQHFRETTSKGNVWLLVKHKLDFVGVERAGLFEIKWKLCKLDV